jgi:hypothetical protein
MPLALDASLLAALARDGGISAILLFEPGVPPLKVKSTRLAEVVGAMKPFSRMNPADRRFDPAEDPRLPWTIVRGRIEG